MNVFRAFRKNPPPTPEREGGLEFHRRSVALSPSAWLALNELAKSEGITKSELVRRIVNSFLTDRDRPQFNPQRMAIICEYVQRSEEHTSELQSLMRISYAVFCLKKNNNI